MGIPAIALTRSAHYQYKFGGLMAMFGIADQVVFSLDDPELEAKLTTAIQQIWASAEERRPALLQAAETQILAGKNAYAEIFKRIDVALVRRAESKPKPTMKLTPQLARTTLALVAKLTQVIAKTQAQRDFFAEHAAKRLQIVEEFDARTKSLQATVQERDETIATLRAQIEQLQKQATLEKDNGRDLHNDSD